MRTVLVMVLVSTVGGCAWFKPDPMRRLAGEWQSEVGGYPIVLTYSDNTVQVNGEPPTRYVREGSSITIVSAAGDYNETRLVSFQGRNTMVQTDPLTGTERTYTRIID